LCTAWGIRDHEHFTESRSEQTYLPYLTDQLAKLSYLYLLALHFDLSSDFTEPFTHSPLSMLFRNTLAVLFLACGAAAIPEGKSILGYRTVSKVCG